MDQRWASRRGPAEPNELFKLELPWLGNPCALETLQEIIREKRPHFIFLVETISSSLKIDEIKNNLGYDGCVAVDNVGHRGGLALLWKSVQTVSLLSSSFWHIDVLVEVAMLGEWRITGFYGRPNRNERRASWALLRELASQYSYPWVCCGDFNAILTQDEKRGGNFYPTYLVQDFRDAVLQAGLSDVNMNGYKYTWDNARDDDDWVEAKLDRFLANDDWKRRFALSKAAVLDYSSSDHLPILLQVRIFLPRHSLVYFVLRILGARRVVVAKLLRKSGRILPWVRFWRSYNFAVFVWVSGEIICGNFISRRLTIVSGKESYWRQRAKEFWLKEGDQNTKFFHRKATIRQRKNRIDRLKDDNGNWCDWSTGLEAMITDYFKNIFTSNAGSSNDIIDLVPL
ncbi:hypothetical protein GH714_017871 [Hevea brasiliensis]|uniref:Endonuclease/exonuclease/phosphatase domain-containing protein n=1 Tax=Hevea brasiliensis TaxID=3981 RepID=A0A6A6L824_HEVBR|nr:hypothetical protein GH714_017871 [Hevea brasiliensis]